MINLLKKILLVAVLASAGVIFVLLYISNDDFFEKISCNSIKIEFINSDKIEYVGENDIKSLVQKNFGNLIGKNIKEIPLKDIESYLEGRSSVLDCEVFLTKDGILHIRIRQRQPVVRFDTSNGSFFSDDTGFIYPAGKDDKADIPEIEGELPDFKIENGKLKYEKDRIWMNDLIKMLEFIDKKNKWKKSVEKIRTDKQGNLYLTLKTGKEIFMFGEPADYETKFGKVEDFNDYIKFHNPNKDYKFVNVKYKGQIICK